MVTFCQSTTSEAGTLSRGLIVYDPGLVAPDGSRGVFRYETNRVYDFFLMEGIHALLAASMPLVDENLALWIQNHRLPAFRADLPLYRASRIDLVFDEDVYDETNFIPLNPGEGYGLMRNLDPDERPNPRDVVIYEALPNDLPRVAGIISAVPQTPLSHVNLRAVQDAVPNAFIRDVLDDADIGALIDSYVYYAVTDNGLHNSRSHASGSRRTLRLFAARRGPDAAARPHGERDHSSQRNRL